MTNIVIYKDKHGFKGFSISGHSGFEEKGQDIVCAAISSAAMLIMNAITEVLKQDADIDIDEENVNIKFMLKSDDQTTRLFIESFNVHMQNLYEQYSENIKLRILEV